MAEDNSLDPQLTQYYNKGLLAFEKKNYDYAIELFSEALKLKKDFADARHYLRLAEQRKLKDSPAAITAVLVNKLKNLPIFLKAIIYDIKNQGPQAIEAYEQILRSEPNNVYILTRLAQSLLKERNAVSTLKAFEEIRLIAPDNIVALKNLGQLYSQAENYAQARECYTTILKIIPHEAEAEKGLKNLDALGAIRESFGQNE